MARRHAWNGAPDRGVAMGVNAGNRPPQRPVAPAILVGMTKPAQPVRKMSISVPPDVAARLDREPNASAFLVEAARVRMRSEALDAELAGRQMRVTPEGRARAAAERAAVGAEWTPERYAAARERSRRAAAEKLDDQAPA